MRLLTIIERVIPNHPSEEQGEKSQVAEIRIDPSEVLRVLSGRRLTNSRSEFRGFSSPPGRF